ncbi:MAG TPA: hypothetical protein VJZ49_12260 [Syntrophales bacterium]|nr:hypothetical protein [Syntrophales bacterium]
MEDCLSTSLCYHKDIQEKARIIKDSQASAGSGIGNTESSEIGDPSHAGVEKDIYALIDLCVHLLESETKKNEISGMQGKRIGLNSQTTATRKRLRYANT